MQRKRYNYEQTLKLILECTEQELYLPSSFGVFHNYHIYNLSPLFKVIFHGVIRSAVIKPANEELAELLWLRLPILDSKAN